MMRERSDILSGERGQAVREGAGAELIGSLAMDGKLKKNGTGPVRFKGGHEKDTRKERTAWFVLIIMSCLA